jgi:predicted RNase H-like nuclease (RuvC/YqgF family)
MFKRIYIHTGSDRAQYASPCAEHTEPAPTEADMLRAELEDTQRVAHYQRETIAAHLSSIDSQRSITKSLSERNIALTKENIALTKENESLKARIRGYDADCHGMQQRIVAQSDALEAKDDVIARMRDTLIAKDKKIAEQAAVINHLSKANVEELEDRIHDLEVKLNFARVALS